MRCIWQSNRNYYLKKRNWEGGGGGRKGKLENRRVIAVFGSSIGLLQPPPPMASKKPPNFYTRYPAQRANSLKKTWVQNAKIKSQWKAEKRKLGIHSRPQPQPRLGNSEEEADKLIDEDLAPGPSKPSTSDAPDLRELARKAYSRDSLHSFKSDPLNRRAGGSSNGKGRGERGGFRGRGQPNMKLRMGVMLEKIKRDFT
ncbi:hypothetical protein D9757_001952 [Collybiopsis confluens]|uniref:Uncharacterized protein n=1 Tax=Collybiopsis confluens TaxID=2823264 RepID=A0A8H5HXK7_9AGAR|nr:hypothetical protein D9757_001952 [Collybiopsis confluens]